ncbi:MAG: flagellar hook-basal body complex protein FliE [Pseudomonadota bacterium]|jgi:flagellar hook-basal body complex protein FliE|nr:flagellar hook-basal body complex protein FliE [Pseudomonadota bacterium]MEC8794997.1 flagellar hook-basal body complex protein FliE [Pseudomonadota bacterium]MEE3318070.1 flagellar hook-basal body complex protein FliE [Pseudomonadota bacterium]
MDIRATQFAAQGYAAAKPATKPDPNSAGNAVIGAVDSFAKTMEQGERAAQASLTNGADPQALVQALAQTELAVETAVTIRNKVVEAYQEILRMPV